MTTLTSVTWRKHYLRAYAVVRDSRGYDSTRPWYVLVKGCVTSLGWTRILAKAKLIRRKQNMSSVSSAPDESRLQGPGGLDGRVKQHTAVTDW